MHTLNALIKSKLKLLNPLIITNGTLFFPRYFDLIVLDAVFTIFQLLTIYILSPNMKAFQCA